MTLFKTRSLSGFRRLGLLAVLSLAALMLLAACADDDDDGLDPLPADPAPAAPADPAPAPADDPAPMGGSINIAYIPGWPDAVSTSNLWKVILEEQGYDVELTALDVAPAFAGLAGGDVDVYLSSWLPHTHGVYTDEFGGDVEIISSWYSPAGLFLTVPAYVEVDSLADLADNADLFDSTIVGIEAGAGMMGILANDVMPAYGLDDWNLIESSTPAMLAELERAIAAEEPVVVTLWSPGWWYGAFDLKNLEDPEGAWGDPDQLTVVSRSGFADEFPQVAAWWSAWSMTDEQYAPLEQLITDMGDGNEEAAVLAWLEENQDLVDSWLQ